MNLVAAGLWIGWTIWQMRGENAEYARISDARIRAAVQENEGQGSPRKDSSPGH